MTVKTEPLEHYESGANRSDRTGKGRFDLIPPRALWRLAKHYENGAKDHGERNWEMGFPISRCVDSTERHLQQVKMGNTCEDHWAAIAWQAMAAMEFEERIAKGMLPPEINDIAT